MNFKKPFRKAKKNALKLDKIVHAPSKSIIETDTIDLTGHQNSDPVPKPKSQSKAQSKPEPGPQSKHESKHEHEHEHEPEPQPEPMIIDVEEHSGFDLDLPIEEPPKQSRKHSLRRTSFTPRSNNSASPAIRSTRNQSKKPQKSTRKPPQRQPGPRKIERKEFNEYIWPNAWFALLELLQIKDHNALNDIYFSSIWILHREGSDRSVTHFERTLFQSLRNYSAFEEHMYLIPFFVASISGKDISLLRDEFFELERANAQKSFGVCSTDELDLAILQTQQQISRLMNGLKMSNEEIQFRKVSQSVSGLSTILKNLNSAQDLQLESVLKSLVDRSRILEQEMSSESGGFLHINTVDDANLPDLIVSFFFLSDFHTTF